GRGPADLLAGTFDISGSSAFGNSGFDAFSGLGAGAADTAPTVTLDTSTSGIVSETITLHGTGSNASGYSGALADRTLTITANVGNTAPVATNDSYTTAEDTPLTVSAPGVLVNDSDADHDALTAAKISGPRHGTLTLNPNGSVPPPPAAHFNGPDSFSYQASDGTAGSNTATVAITVTAVNDPPHVSAPGPFAGTVGQAGALAGITFSDVDGGSGLELA